MLKFISLFFLLLFSSCNKDFKSDLNKIRTYSFELEEEWPYAPPYLLELSKNNKQLWYLGARHENNDNSPTFNLIDDFFVKYNPNIVIVEGI